jgi:mono/diheme cytochrome c family protein
MKIVLILVACVVLAVASGLMFIYSGVYDVSAMRPDNPLVAWAVHKTFLESVAHHSRGLVPAPDLEKPENVRSGAIFFRDNCAVCHGAPGMKRSNISQGLLPSPPDLFEAKRQNDPVEVFWIAKNGVNMTGMPAFGKTQSDEQIWAIAAFLHKARGISAQEFQNLTAMLPDGPQQAAGYRVVKDVR